VLFAGAQVVDKPRLCLTPSALHCSRIPDLLPDVDNPQNQQKISLFPADFVFHKSVDKILIVFAGRSTPRSVDKSVDNFAHVVHNLLSH
jgi:hypothetical protein